jgi:hypothetical protein
MRRNSVVPGGLHLALRAEAWVGMYRQFRPGLKWSFDLVDDPAR